MSSHRKVIITVNSGEDKNEYQEITRNPHVKSQDGMQILFSEDQQNNLQMARNRVREQS